MYNVERKAFIVDVLEKKNAVSVAQLAELLSISKETVRRDLRELEQDNLIRRTHGGAVYEQQNNTAMEHPIAVREIHHYAEKAMICKCAATYVEDGDTIFVDNSSTTITLLKHINPKYQITVITNSIRQLFESVSINNPNMTIISLGGVFRATNYSIAGSLTVDSAKNFFPSKTFISCRAIDTAGLSDGSIYEMETKRALISTAKEVFVLADSSKFAERGTVFLTDLSAVSKVITDDKVSAEALQMLEMAGVEVVIAS